MFRYLIRRLLWAFVLFVAVTIVTYIIFYAIPADPARLACGQRATPECIARAAHYLGTDRPLYVQYGKMMDRLFIKRDLISYQDQTQVIPTIIAGSHVRLGRYRTHVDLYRMLRTIEWLAGLPGLHKSKQRQPLTRLFARSG